MSIHIATGLQGIVTCDYKREDEHVNACPYNKPGVGCALDGAPCVLPKEARWGRVQPSAFETCEHRVMKND